MSYEISTVGANIVIDYAPIPPLPKIKREGVVISETCQLVAGRFQRTAMTVRFRDEEDRIYESDIHGQWYDVGVTGSEVDGHYEYNAVAITNCTKD
jgi:hypothetical protein